MTSCVVLVLGAGGMLGHKVVQTLAGAEGRSLEIHAASRQAVPARFAPSSVSYSTGVDLSSGSGALRPLLDRLRPDVIVNAVGAIKQKDLAPAIDETMFLNGSLPHTLALLNPNPSGRVIHISTDCVFQGTRGSYRHDEPPDALDLYGRSKAVGEIDYGRHVTLRTSMIGYELSSHLGLLSWLLKQPRGSTLRGFTGALFAGLPTVSLSKVILKLITTHDSLTGLYHVASEPINKFELLTRVNAALGLEHRIEPSADQRIDRSLDDTPFRLATQTARPGWDELIAALAADYSDWPYERIYRGTQTSSTCNNSTARTF